MEGQGNVEDGKKKERGVMRDESEMKGQRTKIR